MRECTKCGGMINADVTELGDDDTFCTCPDQGLSLNKKLDKDIDWMKKNNKRNAKHWKNGRERKND